MGDAGKSGDLMIGRPSASQHPATICDIAFCRRLPLEPVRTSSYAGCNRRRREMFKRVLAVISSRLVVTANTLAQEAPAPLFELPLRLERMIHFVPQRQFEER